MHFLNENVWFSNTIWLKFVTKGPINNSTAEQATSHYLNQWWPSLVTHICVTWPQWVKAESWGHFAHAHQTQNIPSEICWWGSRDPIQFAIVNRESVGMAHQNWYITPYLSHWSRLLTFKQLGHFLKMWFHCLILLTINVLFLLWNWSDIMNIFSALWILMARRFSITASGISSHSADCKVCSHAFPGG